MKLREEIGTLSHTAAVAVSPGGFIKLKRHGPVGAFQGPRDRRTDGVTDRPETSDSTMD